LHDCAPAHRAQLQTLALAERKHVRIVSAEEFLNSDRLDEIGCLITDVKMPGMSGLELQAKLSEDKRDIPIIFITGHGESRALAIRAGAVAFFDKPFDDNLLLELVREIVNPETNP
jgi:FixJ family two-component response regulator